MSEENVPPVDQPTDQPADEPVGETGQSADQPTGQPADQPPSASTEGASAPGSGGTEWRDVVNELNALGEALGRWVKAAVDDEDNKRRAAEFRARLDGFAAKVGEVVKDATDSEVGRSFKEAADKTGEAFKQAGEKISEEAAPKAATAFRGFADKLRDAATRIEQQAADKAEAGPAAGEASAEKPSADSTPSEGPDDSGSSL